jgi:hypothetical protein
MLCEVCAGSRPVIREGETVGLRRVGAADGPTCSACHCPVDVSGAARVAAKIAQLSRFGLTGQRLLARRSA